MPPAPASPPHDLPPNIVVTRHVLPPREEIASVPRRYGAGTLLVITTAYALLFAGFKAFDADQIWWVATAIFLTGIGIAQMIAGPSKARGASMIAGAILLPLLMIGAGMYYDASSGQSPFRRDFLLPVCGGLLGVPLGYAGGVLVGGIFLLMRYADAVISRMRRPKAEEEPLDAQLAERGEPE